MWVLVTNLPLIIGDLVPLCDELWECFLLHADILQLCTAKKVTTAQAGYLEALIHDHHQMYTRCYSARLPPKTHYMVHFPLHKIIIFTGHETFSDLILPIGLAQL